MRIPFSSIRYGDPDPDHWGLMLYRNRPRDFRYQYFTSKLPRDRNCFICSVRELQGLANLPTGDHWVIAPYVSGSRLEEASGGAGTPLESQGEDGEVGVDVKWIPNPDTIVDATLTPSNGDCSTPLIVDGASMPSRSSSVGAMSMACT